MAHVSWSCIEIEMLIPLGRSPCLKTVDGKSERGKFLVLRSVLLKNAYFNSANRQLSIVVLPKEL